jgi:hypothetical protein
MFTEEQRKAMSGFLRGMGYRGEIK